MVSSIDGFKPLQPTVRRDPLPDIPVRKTRKDADSAAPPVSGTDALKGVTRDLTPAQAEETATQIFKLLQGNPQISLGLHGRLDAEV